MLKSTWALLMLVVAFLFGHSAHGQRIEIQKVMTLFQNQQYEEAVAYLRPIEQAEPQNLEVLGYIGYAYYMGDNYKSARKYYERILNADSNNVAALRYLASITESPAPDSSMLLLRRLISLQPGVASYYRNLGDLLRRSKERDSALVYFQQAYGLLPTDPKNGAALADLLIFSKSYKTADSIILAGLTQDSLNVPFLKLRVKCAYEAEDYKSAIAAGETLIRLEEPALAALTQLVLSYYNLAKYADSYRVCEYMIAESLDPEPIYYYQSRAAAKLKDYDKSNELLKLCLTKAISGTAEQYYYNLGQNYEATAQYKKAVQQYDTAFYLFKDPNMLYYMASLYESKLNDPGAAKKYYTKYLALAKPTNPYEVKAFKYVRERWGKTNRRDTAMLKNGESKVKNDE